MPGKNMKIVSILKLSVLIFTHHVALRTKKLIENVHNKKVSTLACPFPFGHPVNALQSMGTKTVGFFLINNSSRSRSKFSLFAFAGISCKLYQLNFPKYWIS